MVMSIRSALPKIRRFMLSGRYFALLAILGAIIFISASIMLGIPPSEVYDAPRVAPTQVAGVIIFVLIISATLVIHDDILAVLPPFLVLCVFACDCYNSFSVFSRLWWLGIPAVAAALHSGWITTGERTKRFEARLAEYMGRSRVACLNSQTAAAEQTLRLLGIGEGGRGDSSRLHLHLHRNSRGGGARRRKDRNA